MSGYIHWRVERLALVDSTNTTASERVRALWQTAATQEVEGLVIVAGRQRAGRGQHGRTWESPPGGLYLSAVVERLPPESRDKLALVAGVAAASADWARGLKIGLRWPNDLMLAEKKLGGILCESVSLGERWAGIVGIGLNINTQLADLSAATQGHATSLLAHDGQRRDPGGIESSILGELARVVASLSHAGIAPVLQRARALDTLLGRRVEVQDDEQILRGAAAGLGDGGELLLTVDERLIICPRGTLLAVDGERVRS